MDGAEERERTERELVQLTRSAPLVRHEQLRHQLDGFDAERYRAAKAAIEHEPRVAELARAFDLATARRDAAVQAAEADQVEVERVTALDAEIGPARDALARAAGLRTELDGLEVRANRLQSAVLAADERHRRAQADLDLAAAGSVFDRLRNRGQRAALRAAADRSAAELAHLVEAARSAGHVLDRQRTLLEPEIAGHRRAAGPVDEAEVARRAELVRQARARSCAAPTRPASSTRGSGYAPHTPAPSGAKYAHASHRTVLGGPAGPSADNRAAGPHREPMSAGSRSAALRCGRRAPHRGCVVVTRAARCRGRSSGGPAAGRGRGRCRGGRWRALSAGGRRRWRARLGAARRRSSRRRRGSWRPSR
jgi:hypothetical protein